MWINRVAILLLLFLAACSNDSGDNISTNTEVTAPDDAVAVVPAATDVAPTETFSSDACAWELADQDQPELASEVQAALSRLPAFSGVDVSVTATARGENCRNQSDGLSRFFAMYTDFAISADAPPDAPTTAMIESALQMLISDFPRGETPGPNDGNISIEIFTGNETPRTVIGFLRAPYSLVAESLADGLTGADLISALAGVAQ